MTNHKPLTVVAAIIENPHGQLLIAERPPNKAWAGYWEFPGGKIEPGESHEAALLRELREELGLDLANETLTHYYHGSRGAEVILDFSVSPIPRHNTLSSPWQIRLNLRRHP